MKRKQHKPKKKRLSIGTAIHVGSCNLYSAFWCSRCGTCYHCRHEVVEREEANAIKWYRCPDGFEKPAYMDLGQFAPLRRSHPDRKGIQWEQYESRS